MEQTCFVQDENPRKEKYKEENPCPYKVSLIVVLAFYDSPFADAFSIKGLIRSIGTGNIIVEFFSVAISVRVWRNLSCKAPLSVAIILAASASF
jgi:hypothetical protein